MKILNATALTVLLTGTILAQPPAEPGESRPPRRSPPRWSIGVGGVYKNDPYEGIDEEFIALPLLAYRGERLTFVGPFASYKIYTPDRLAISAVAGYSFDGYDADDSSVFDGMDDREGTVEAGLQINYELPAEFETSARVISDVMGRHDGLKAVFELERTFVKGRGTWIIKPSIGVRWENSDFTDYYYGVRDSEATPSRAAYAVDDAFSWEAGCNLIYNYKPNISLMIFPRLELLDNEITDSPIVGEDLLFRAMVGITYGL